MTEKRFTLAYEKDDWWAVKDGDITLWKEEVIATLNEQDQRIQELEDFIKVHVEGTVADEVL